MVKQLFSPRQRRRLQRLNEQFMPDLVTILVPNAVTPDGRGGFSQSFTDGPTVACRFRSSTKKADSVIGGRGGNQELVQFVLPAETVVETTYRLRRNGITYEVVGFPTDGSYQISKKVLVKKV